MIPNPLQPYIAIGKLLLPILIGLLIWFHGAGWGEKRGAIKLAELKAEHAQVLASMAAETSAANAAARLAEQAKADEIAAIAADHESKQHEIAKTARDQVLADIRAGRVRVRIDPQGCPVPGPAEAAAITGIDADAAELRGTDQIHLAIARTIELAEQADNDIRQCQAVAKADRQ